MALDKYVVWQDGLIGVELSKRKLKAASPGRPVSAVTEHPAFAGLSISSVRHHAFLPNLTFDVPVSTLRFDAAEGSLTMLDEAWQQMR